MRLSFGHVESALAQHFRVRADRRKPFASRLKHFQRMGFPPGTNTGRGIAATYHVGHPFLLGLALALSEFGLTPERCIAVLGRNARTILQALGEAATQALERSNPVPMVLYFDAAAFSEVMSETDGTDYGRFTFASDEVFRGVMEPLIWDKPLMGFINVSQLVPDLASSLAGQACGGTKEEWLRSLEAWTEPQRDDY